MPAAVLIHGFYSYYRSRKEQQRLKAEQEKIQKAFASYVPPQMAAELAKEGYKLELSGKKVLASAMFTDIASFTSISESLTPEEVAEMLNAYFTEMGHVIFDNNGTLIKFIGDAVFVIWGAPIDMADHADRALATAMDANEKLKEFNAQKRFPHLHTRIGVHSGYMVAGNLGTNWRFDYTAIGDAVNLSARVEGINKYLGTSVLVTEDTKKLLTRPADLMAMGSVQVVGKEIAVELYTPAWPGLTEEIRALWANAISSFRERKFEVAKQQFEQVTASCPELKKGASQYLHDIEDYLVNPPSEKWQGELVFSSK
jgi:adenylate cyclase